jgi:hypothetical protein
MSATPARAWACKCTPRAFKPIAEHSPIPRELVDRFAPDELLQHQAHEARLVHEASYHEAGHAVVSVAYGQDVEYVTTANTNPHCRYLAGDAATVHAALVRSAAGDIGSGIARGLIVCPPADDLAANLKQARTGHRGTCDRCQCAALLVHHFPDASDADLVNYWRAEIAFADRLLEVPAVRSALHRVAAALRDKVLLTGNEVLDLVDVDELRAAVREVAT